jgi:hypothetical protein
MTCLTGDGKTLDFVIIQANNTCLTEAELNSLRGGDKNLNIALRVLNLDGKSKCIGLYEFELVSKPARYVDHGKWCCFLKFVDKIEMFTTSERADSLLNEFFKKDGMVFSEKERKMIGMGFKKGCVIAGGI